MEHLEFWLALVANLVAIGVAYGVVKTKVNNIEAQYSLFRVDYGNRHAELIEEIRMIRVRIQELTDMMIRGNERIRS